MKLEVKSVITPDSFELKSPWEFDDESGYIVVIRGINTTQASEKEIPRARERLSKLILNKRIQLKNPTLLSRGKVYCDVYFKGENIVDYFPEYQW